jgi:hypothetical protein
VNRGNRFEKDVHETAADRSRTGNRSRGKRAFFLGFLMDDREKQPLEVNFWRAVIKKPRVFYAFTT